MSKFGYVAVNETGASVSGTIEAESRDAAENLLVSRGYIPSRLTEDRSKGSGTLSLRIQEKLTQVKPQELILFTKQFRTLLKAGVPILSILQVLERQSQNARLRRVATEMGLSIHGGATLHDAFRKHPRVFSPLYCSMIRAGETSGSLPEVLERLTYIVEHEHKIWSDIKSALQYPIMVVFALGIAFFILLNFVVPKFAAIFLSAGLQLPWPTRLCMELHRLMADYWHFMLAAFIMTIVALKYYLATEQGKLTRDGMILRLPVFGSLFIKAAMSRFASIFSILQRSGVPILDSLKILAGTIGNHVLARELNRIRDRVEEGRGIASPLKSTKHFTPMTIDMIAIGEESGNLDDMLSEISVHYDDEVGYAIKGLTEALGPFLIVGLAAVVGFFALAIFLPMWDLASIAQRGV